MDSMSSGKKHKKHKKDKYESGDRPSGLKLILKVGSCSTPEHSDSPLSQSTTFSVNADDSYQGQLFKKSKKKKRKKDKKEKKKKHRDKKRRYDSDCMILGDDSTGEMSKKDFKDEISNPSLTPSREPRMCVLRQKQERTPLQKTLEYLQRQLEKKDPQTFFAWPVTDQIAPGYSKTISQPMDFSTMKQKIDDNEYPSLDSYIDDFKLMCNNAMTYNHPETIYYKAAKRLLHAGLKLLNPNKLCQLANTIPGISMIPKEQLGFHLGIGRSSIDYIEEEGALKREHPDEEPKSRDKDLPDSKFEAVPDKMSAEQILEQARKAAQASSEKLCLKRPKTSMGFLRQQVDGSTSLAVLIPGEGVDPERPRERSVSLGQLVGKLTHGTGQLQGFREDRRNIAKAVKPLNYGAFGSYAPSYDSTFSNLSKEESDLLFETYGDENATAYAESVLNFAKDCDYTLTMVDNLLDMLTGGEHRKTKSIIDEHRKFREEEERVKELMENKTRVKSTPAVLPPSAPTTSINETPPQQIKIEVDQLKTLSDLGIDVSFLDDLESDREVCVQDKLDQTSTLIEKLQQVQNDRLSAIPPAHLSQVLPPSDTELHLAEKITDSLTELAKQVSLCYSIDFFVLFIVLDVLIYNKTLLLSPILSLLFLALKSYN